MCHMDKISSWPVHRSKTDHLLSGVGHLASKAAEAVGPCTSATPPKADVNSPPWLPPLSAKTGLMHCSKRFEQVEGDGLDAVADGELVALGKLLARRREPSEEPVVRLDRRAGAPGIVRHRIRAPKKI